MNECVGSRARLWSSIVFSAWILVVSPAAAQQTEGEREARGLFAAGEAAYSEGRYDRAYEYFTQAYEISGRAPLLYNMGLAAERARLDREAVAAYERFLEAVPEHEQREFVQRRLSVLREQLERAAADREARATPLVDAAPAAPAPVEPAPVRSDDSGLRLGVGVTLAIVGVGGLATGWGLWGALQSTYDEYDALAPAAQGSAVFTDLQGDIYTLEWATLTAGAIGGAVLTAAMPFLLPDEDGVPWWSWAVGGVGLVVAGLGAWQLAESGEPIGPGNVISTEPAWLGGHLMAHAVPLLSVPLVYLIRDVTGSSSAGATVEVDAQHVGLRVFGAL